MSDKIQEICERAESFRDKPTCGVKASRYVSDIDYLVDEILRLDNELRKAHIEKVSDFNAERESSKPA